MEITGTRNALFTGTEVYNNQQTVIIPLLKGVAKRALNLPISVFIYNLTNSVSLNVQVTNLDFNVLEESSTAWQTLPDSGAINSNTMLNLNGVYTGIRIEASNNTSSFSVTITTTSYN